MHEALASWKPVREELINYRKDGTEFHVDLSIVPVADQKGSFTHWVSIQRETTEQNGVRAALQESESRLRTLMDALPQLLWTADAQGCCTYVSESYCQFLGVRSEGCMGLRWIDCVHPEDRERVIATWNDALMRKTTFITEYRLVRHDGAYRWFLHRALPGLDAAGNVVEWIGTLN
jgi:PAS domain S-box-containing protein